jgi:hypothetical protein
MEKTEKVSVTAYLVQWWTNRLFPGREARRSHPRDQREAAARFTRGNIAIQAGSFITKDDLEHQRVEVSKIVFPQ